ncbi:hypothetical protein B0H10DRAFT_2108790 [Mycena sp. CBHHK59/15]|nr:hypothetical protein B0H10DRAFT_2108790 [Mycena sp. CBHHK59/15]
MSTIVFIAPPTCIPVTPSPLHHPVNGSNPRCSGSGVSKSAATTRLYFKVTARR